MPFDPDAPIVPGDAIFGLPHSFDEASVILIPVPYDATCSYGVGSSRGPDAIREASAQLDLLDRRFGAIYERGIHMLETPTRITELSERTRDLVSPISNRGEAIYSDAQAVAAIDAAGDEVNTYVREHVRRVLEAGKTPGLIGGEHSVSFAAIEACAEANPGMGILQIDAHMDLRHAYQGFRWSHASVMYNVIENVHGLESLTQVGIRDYCRAETEVGSERVNPVVETHYWDDLAYQLLGGVSWAEIAGRIVEGLPNLIYISVDIDGLQPHLCPNTGTPVPGGLDFDQLSLLLATIKQAGKKVVGFDVVEVVPAQGSNATPINESIGARVLYRLCGLTG